MPNRPRPAEFCDDDELGYLARRSTFAAGAAMPLDETYRLAHLPLIAPDHPRVIARREGADYAMGRHPRIFSLVLPIPWPALLQSPSYQALDSDVRASPFSRKIAWDVVERRKEKLHATICGSLSVDEPPVLTEDQRGELARIGPVSVELRGLFSGTVNVGRLYLRVYPERRGGMNVFREIQRRLGRPETDIYLVGLYNLLDDLDGDEAAALASLIERWWDRPILRFDADDLWLLGASDDLVLDSAVADRLSLV